MRGRRAHRCGVSRQGHRDPQGPEEESSRAGSGRDAGPNCVLPDCADVVRALRWVAAAGSGGWRNATSSWLPSSAAGSAPARPASSVCRASSQPRPSPLWGIPATPRVGSARGCAVVDSPYYLAPGELMAVRQYRNKPPGDTRRERVGVVTGRQWAPALWTDPCGRWARARLRSTSRGEPRRRGGPRPRRVGGRIRGPSRRTRCGRSGQRL